jgi:hypothetical protein
MLEDIPKGARKTAFIRFVTQQCLLVLSLRLVLSGSCFRLLRVLPGLSHLMLVERSALPMCSEALLDKSVSGHL